MVLRVSTVGEDALDGSLQAKGCTGHPAHWVLVHTGCWVTLCEDTHGGALPATCGKVIKTQEKCIESEANTHWGLIPMCLLLIF